METLTIEILEKESRKELDARALELGIKDADKMANKGAVIEAIVKALEPEEVEDQSKEKETQEADNCLEDVPVSQVYSLATLTEKIDRIEKDFGATPLEKKCSETPLTEKQLRKQRKKNIKAVKHIRTGLDTMHRLAKLRSIITPKVEDSIFLGKSWLGHTLASFGTDNPYAGEDKVKNKKDIPPTADVSVEDKFLKVKRDFELLDDLQSVYFLRKHLGEGMTVLAKFLDENTFEDKNTYATLQKSINNLTEARFYLGEILSEIRES